MPPPFSVCGGRVYSLSVCTYVCTPRMKMDSFYYHLKSHCIGFILYTHVYNYKIKVEVGFGVKSTRYLGVMALFHLNLCLKNGSSSLSFETNTKLD